MRWPKDSWHGRNARIMRIVLGVAMVLWRGTRLWAILALVGWGLMRFVLYSTSIMCCPHCDKMLWELSRKVEDIHYCPYCGYLLDPDYDRHR